MNKPVRKVAEVAAENPTSQDNNQATQNPEVKMQVLKPEPPKEPEPQPEPEPKPQKALSIEEIKRVSRELNYLSEQHDNLTSQLEKVQQFAAEVGEEATLRLTSNGINSFTSKDPAAVSAMVEICVSNLKKRIADVEQKLKA
jgi:vacuolar-type H+-ATPase subunit I/STV1